MFGQYNLKTKESSQAESSYSNRSRPSFPIFSGKDDQGWLYRMEQLLDYFNITGDQRVKIAVIFLEEGSSDWYKWKPQSKGEFLSWDKFE